MIRSLSRRHFVSTMAAFPIASSLPAFGGTTGEPIRFGLISDLHQDIIPDAVPRLQAFIETMATAKVDFIAQLGDFCQPLKKNEIILETWNQFAGPRHHVLGNHDMDGGANPEQTVAFYGMPSRYYAFVAKGIRFIVLDGNEPGGTSTGYKRFIGNEQADWLKKELQQTREPVVVLIHQPLDRPSGVENQEEIRKILNGDDNHRPQILAVFSGHLHKDYHVVKDGQNHIQINSAAYLWMGEKYNHFSYDEETHSRHRLLKSTCPYRDPLWGIVTIDLAQGALTLEGRKTEWVGKSPWEVGATQATHPQEIVRPEIVSRTVSLRPS